jgi:hypothetical protein
MTTNQQNDPAGASSHPPRLSSEEIIRRLEEFPVEVLQQALLALQMRKELAAE